MAPVWTTSAFWHYSYSVHKFLQPIHGATVTRGEIAIVHGLGILFAILVTSLYHPKALPPEGAMRYLFSLTNYYIAASCITHTTSSVKSWWDTRTPRTREYFVVGNGLALILGIATLPRATVYLCITFVLTMAGFVITVKAPSGFADPLSTAFMMIVIVILCGLGQTLAAAPMAIAFYVFIAYIFAPSHAQTSLELLQV